MSHDVFISYTQPDRVTAFRAHDLFQANGLVSWIAVSPTNGIPAGKAFEGEIVRAIRASSHFVLIYSAWCNESPNILRELGQLAKQQLFVLRLDNSGFSDDLSWYLKNAQHIDARLNLPSALNDLLLAIRDSGRRPANPSGLSGSAATSTDKLLFHNGIQLLAQRRYSEAVTLLQQYLNIEPADPRAGFYLALALIAGQPTRKLDGLLVRRLESILDQKTGSTRVLLAILKEGDYTGNGFRMPPPEPPNLVNGATIDPEAAAALLLHLTEPSQNLVWSFIQKQLRNQ